MRVNRLFAFIVAILCVLAPRAAIAAGPYTATSSITEHDVVVWDSSADNGVTATTTENSQLVAGIAINSVSIGQTVNVRTDGAHVLLNVTTATRGQWIVTSTTLGKGKGVDTREDGAFAVAMTDASGGQCYVALMPGLQDGKGATDHGALTGLADDDHTQYHNDTRGDARYLYVGRTDPFTPDADYEPATKKYVDDNAGETPSDSTPAAVADTGAAGSSDNYARGDHVHKGVTSIQESGDEAARYGVIQILHNAGMAVDQYLNRPADWSAVDGYAWVYDYATRSFNLEEMPGAAGGEANTGSNVGGGAEVFKTKTGIDFVHRTLLSENAALVLYENANDVTFEIALDWFRQNYLAKDNEDGFTPDADYEPATKKSSEDAATAAAAAAKADVLDGSAYTGTHNFGDATLELPNTDSGDVTVAEGEIKQKSHEDGFAVNMGSAGEAQGEAFISALIVFGANIFDPNAAYAKDHEVKVTDFGPEAPNGVTVAKIKVENDSSSYELTASLCYADDFITQANEVVIDVITTTSGTVTIDSGFDNALIPTGKVVYVKVTAEPNATLTQSTVTVWAYAEED
jgi:hypothetical protein